MLTISIIYHFSIILLSYTLKKKRSYIFMVNKRGVKKVTGVTGVTAKTKSIHRKEGFIK